MDALVFVVVEKGEGSSGREAPFGVLQESLENVLACLCEGHCSEASSAEGLADAAARCCINASHLF